MSPDAIAAAAELVEKLPVHFPRWSAVIWDVNPNTRWEIVGYPGKQNVTLTWTFFWFLATYLPLPTCVRWLRKSSSMLSLRGSFGAFHYDVIVQIRSSLAFNNSKFDRDRNSFKPLLSNVKFILSIFDWFYATYSNIQPSRDTWTPPPPPTYGKITLSRVYLTFCWKTVCCKTWE